MWTCCWAHFPAWPVLAAQLGLLRALAPAAVASYEGTRVLFAVLLVGLFGLYGLALWSAAWASRRAVVIAVVMMTLVCQAVLFPLPGVFSTDLFSYAFYGEVAGRLGGSPYVQVPDDFPTIPLYLLINPLWRDAPSVYGPVWIALSTGVGALWGGDVLAQVLAYRLIANVCHWANLAACGGRCAACGPAPSHSGWRSMPGTRSLSSSLLPMATTMDC